MNASELALIYVDYCRYALIRKHPNHRMLTSFDFVDADEGFHSRIASPTL